MSQLSTRADSVLSKGAYSNAFPIDYTSRLLNLKPNLTYYVRPFATNKEGTTYGVVMTINTGVLLPVFLNGMPFSAGESSIKVTSTLSSNGGDDITQHEHWICEGWFGEYPESILGIAQKTELGMHVGGYPYTYTSEFTKLKTGTLYTIFAYATNAACTVFSVQSVKTEGTQAWSFDDFREAIDIGRKSNQKLVLYFWDWSAV